MKKGYRCLICGYVHIGSEAPNVCPICGASTGEFELFEDKNKRGTSSSEYWRCVNCEYIHEGSTPPDQCPVCGVTKSEFEAIEKKAAHHISTDNARILIIGGGIAGLSAAEEIRKHSQTAVITIISNEKQLPYYRLNLTRYLSGDVDKRNLEIHPKEWYDQKNITILHGKEVLNIDANNKEVVLDDQVRVQYDTLIVALGAHPFVPPIPGHQKKNVITVRKIEDADFILNKIGETGSCICIGGGILGLEAAGAIAKNGIKVTLLEGAPWLMPRQLNKRASEILKGHLQKIGIEVRDNVRIKEITGNQECDGVLLETGERLPTKLVMITAGVRSNTHLARKAGLEVNQGVVVDNHLRTSDANIYAAGDICEHYGVVYGLWNAAQYQGKVAALNALGIESLFGGMPRSSILKVLDLDLFSIGDITPTDGSYYQFETERDQRYYAFILRDGKITGSIIIGDKAMSLKVKQAVENETRFPRDLFSNVDDIMNKLR